MTIEEARKIAELSLGQRLDEQTYQEVLAYTRRKAYLTGHGDDYVPLLLVDEIKDHVFREKINWIYHEAQAAFKEIDDMAERGEWPCAKSALPTLA